MTWFTSDQHFFHKRIREFCPVSRASRDIEHMNELLIEAHNKTVPPNGVVYYLGDFSFGTEAQTLNVLQRLHGVKHLVLGNHDQVIRKSAALQSMFESVADYKTSSHNKIKIVMFHFPIAKWESAHRGAYHLHGHSHGDYQGPGRCLDVGVDARAGNLAPWHIDEIDAVMRSKESLSHHN